MLVLAPFDDLWRLADRERIVLSPHALDPLPGAPGGWLEEELLRSGTFNGGFLGVGPGAEPFLDWLAERARRDCVRDPERGLLYTQTWLDLVPALFGGHVLRDRGVNAQYHALHGRDVEWASGGPRIGADPLRLFHFAGFDPASRTACAAITTPPSSATGQVSRACAATTPSACKPPAGRARLRRRHCCPTPSRGPHIARRCWPPRRGRAPSRPCQASPGFEPWLAAPPGAPATNVSRYLLALHAARADVRAAFRLVPGADEDAYLRWAAEKAAEPEPEFPRAMAPRSAAATAS